MKLLSHTFQYGKHFRNRMNRYQEIAKRTWTKMHTFIGFADRNRKYSWWRHFRSKCKTIVCYVAVNFDVASWSSFRLIKNKVITTMVIRPLDDHTFCSICVPSFGALAKVVRSLHHFTTSQCILNCVLLIFSLTSNRLAEIWKGDFSTPDLGRYRGTQVAGDGPIRQLAHGSC